MRSALGVLTTVQCPVPLVLLDPNPQMTGLAGFFLKGPVGLADVAYPIPYRGPVAFPL